MSGLETETADAEAAKAFDLFNPPEDYFEAPHVWHERLRAHDPIHANSDGSVLLTRYDDVKTVWRDISGLVDKREQFHRKFGDGPLFEHHTTGMLFRDPPDHDRLRAIVNPFFTPASIKRLSEFIDGLVDEALEDVAAKGKVDFVDEFAFRIPINVICKILGVPQSDGLYIHNLGRHILFALNPHCSPDDIARGHEATAEFKAYLRNHVERLRKQGKIDAEESVMSAMVAVEQDGGEISENEILHMCILMLNGGHETTTNLMGISMHYLLDQPDQLSDLRANPEIIDTAIEELLRLVTPLQLQGRRTTKEITIPSGTIAENTEVVLCQGSANRDDAFFEGASSMNLRRKPNQHVSFGAGIHVCIGRPLARLEAKIALPKVLARFQSIERTGPHRFARNVRFRGIESLPLALA